MSPVRVISNLVSVKELMALMAEPDVRVVDVRWRLGVPLAGRELYAKGHIPGAAFADVDADLAGAPGAGGRHPLPSPEAFAAAMTKLGIHDGTRVIAYDDMGGATAARLWFLLRYFGHETCAVLDGGFDAFVAAGHTVDTIKESSPDLDVAPPREGLSPGQAFHAVPHPDMLLDRAGVLAWVARPGTLLLDARAPERYRGDVEPIDPRAGHIPHAVNAPFAENLDAGRFRSPDVLRERYASLGAAERETAVYCGSGVTACHDVLALAVAGLPDAKLYAGSWSEWARDPAADVVVG